MGEKVAASGRLVLVVPTGFDEYQTSVFRGIKPVLVDRGLSAVLHCSDPFFPRLSPAITRFVRHATPVGAIVASCHTPVQDAELAELLEEFRVPTVRIAAFRPGTTTVHGDNASGMRALMHHLLVDCGVRRPVMIRGLLHASDSDEREQVFRQELIAHGLEIDEELFLAARWQHDVAYAVLRDLLRRRRDFDAVVGANDLTALGAMAALADDGVRVPEDVLVCGFDNETLAGTHWPGLTTVDQNLELQGAAVARRLLEEIDGTPPGGEIVVPSRLVVRGSTGLRHLRRREKVAITMAQAAQRQLAEQDALMGLGRGLIQCRRLAEIPAVLGAGRLERLGITRCFLGIYEDALHSGDAGTAPGAPSRAAPRSTPGTASGPKASTNGGPDASITPASEASTDGTARRAPGGLARLILDYRDGRAAPPPDELFPDHRLLPSSLEPELHRGALVFQPLSVAEQGLGYVLFEQVRGLPTVTEALRMDLTRTLESLFSTRALNAHAGILEELVARRTRQLESEVRTRRRAERELQQVNAQLKSTLLVDGLTRIGNRSALDQRIAELQEESGQGGQGPDDVPASGSGQAPAGDRIAVLMVDVDFFKAYNDHYGHRKGDEALIAVALALSRATRYPQDLACRYGGEEFAVLLPGSEVSGAMVVARRFRELLADAALPHDASPVAPVVTASIGVATGSLGAGASVEALLEAADSALYEAKALGRNRIQVAGAQLAAPPG